MRSRTAAPSLLIAVSVVCALTGCSTLERLGFDEVVDQRDWTWPEDTPEPELSEDDAIAGCIEAVVARFDIADSSVYPEASARASRFNDGWKVFASPSRTHSEEPTYYCLTDGPDVKAHTEHEYQQIFF